MTPIRLDASTIMLHPHDLSAQLSTSHDPNAACDGWAIGIAEMPPTPPHRGERHPNGDEVLYVIKGTATITLELPRGDETANVASGDAFVVPRRVWHQVTPSPAVTLIHMTPGPNQEHRPQ